MGASKSGESLNLITAVLESERIMLKRSASAPAEIVRLASSLTVIVAASTEVAMFSPTEKEVDEVKVGGVVSDASILTVKLDPSRYLHFRFCKSSPPNTDLKNFGKNRSYQILSAFPARGNIEFLDSRLSSKS